MKNITHLVRDNIRNLTPYSSARDEYKGKTGVFLDANENPYGTLNRYPDPRQEELKTVICNILKVEKDCLFIGNGSDEIIDLAMRIFCNPGTDRILLFTPTYGVYEVSASINDITVLTVPLKDDFQINISKAEQLFDDEKLKMTFICSPNNPTGHCMTSADIEYIIQKFKGIVLLDEAYIDFCKNHSFVRMISRYDNLIVMQTLSKARGLAAARIGTAFASPSIIHYFNVVKPPYNISTLNQQAALERLSDQNSCRTHVTEILNERTRLRNDLGRLKLVEHIYPSDANFLLVRVNDAYNTYKYLVDNEIIVRNRSSLIDNCIRITVGTREENDRLINALKRKSI